MYILLFLLLLLVDYSLESDEICYPSVFLHSQNSLPSTAPLCLIVKNDRSISSFSPPVPLQNRDQWEDFVRENNLAIDRDNEPLTPNLIYRVSSSGQIYPWQLPYSFQSEKCHGTTTVEWKVPVSVECQPLTEFTRESCERNPLSSTALLADEFILEGMNNSVSVNTSSFDLLPPVWRDERCINVLLKTRLIISLNRRENEFESARIDRLIYGVIDSSNFSSTVPEISIRYEQSERRKGATVESGFDEGDFVLLGDGRSVWKIPSGLDCLDRSIVRFKQDFLSSCIIGFSSCSDAQSRVTYLLSSLPPSIIDSPFLDNSTNVVPFISPRGQSINPLDSGCTFTSGVSLVITHSLSGPVQSPKRLITSALLSHQFSRLPSIPSNSTAVFLFSLKFLDVTPDPTHTFSSPPRIDLRLPNDFFYPFLFNFAPSSTFTFSSVIIYLVLFK